MKTVYDIITQVANTASTNEKVAILKANSGNKDLKYFLFLCLSPRMNYFVRKYDAPKTAGNTELTMTELNRLVADLTSRQVTGNAAIERVEAFVAGLTTPGQEMVKWMLDKSIRGGIGIKLVNKAFGHEAIWDSSNHYMRCSLPSEKLIEQFDWSNAVCQKKFDGAYIEVGADIGCRTRSGNVFPLESQPCDPSGIDGIIMGEIVIYDRGLPLPREASNGIINSALQGTPIPPQYFPMIHAWDWRPNDDKEYKVPYSKRLVKLNEIAERYVQIEMVYSVKVSSYADALNWASEQIANGFEGAVLKTLTMPWKAGTSKEQIKLKVECDIDLLATEFVPGDKNGKHADTFGSIRCKTSDGKLSVDVSGISDAQRKEFHANPEQIIGKVVTVTFNDITTADGEPSLFLPRFGNKQAGKIMVRTDKTEADTLDRLIEIFHATTGIRKTI